MPKIDLSNVEIVTGTGYPSPFDTPCLKRRAENISDAGGLTQFGVKRITLAPGVWSSQRHWHSHEDELVYIISGNPTLIDETGETILSPGDFTTHPAGDDNGHHMINRTDEDVVFIIVGTRQPSEDSCHYPDVDLSLSANGTSTREFTRKDRTKF